LAWMEKAQSSKPGGYAGAQSKICSLLARITRLMQKQNRLSPAPRGSLEHAEGAERGDFLFIAVERDRNANRLGLRQFLIYHGDFGLSGLFSLLGCRGLTLQRAKGTRFIEPGCLPV